MAKTIPADEKVFMVSKTTNTTYSGSAALKAMNEWYTMDDVTNTVRPYKVYTALLTQSGGSNGVLQQSGTLTVGVTYFIAASFTGDDFSNVGGPKITFDDEYLNTYFVATGTTPNNWTHNTEFDYNTGAPVATVLENTIGNVWFTYFGVGYYVISSNSLFTVPYAIFISNNTQDPFEPTQIVKTRLYDIDTMHILSFAGNSQSDYILGSTPIEIRVYS
jgi:hypothetical protein